MRSGEGVHQRRRAIAEAWRLVDLVSFSLKISFLFFSSVCAVFSSAVVSSLRFVLLCLAICSTPVVSIRRLYTR